MTTDKITCATSEGSEALAAGAVTATSLLAAFPIVSPLVQIWLLAQKSKEEIEDIVRLNEPLQVSLVHLPLTRFSFPRLLGCWEIEFTGGSHALKSDISPA